MQFTGMARVKLTCVSLVLGHLLVGCGFPPLTSDVELGECASLILPITEDHQPDSYFEFYDSGYLLSGKAASSSADPDDFPQEFSVVGPTIARLVVTRGKGSMSATLVIPEGSQMRLTDERSIVRCRLIGPGAGIPAA